MARTRKNAGEKRFAVRATLANANLAKAGSALTLLISSRGEKLGEIQIGRGSLFWWGANRKRRKRIAWSKFSEMMNRLAYGD
jgi:hypothetical protein